MQALKRKILLTIGWAIVIIGLALGPIPGPGGIPIVAGGAILVLSQSRAARRQFIHLERRFPKFITPIRRFMSRKNKI